MRNVRLNQERNISHEKIEVFYPGIRASEGKGHACDMEEELFTYFQMYSTSSEKCTAGYGNELRLLDVDLNSFGILTGIP